MFKIGEKFTTSIKLILFRIQVGYAFEVKHRRTIVADIVIANDLLYSRKIIKDIVERMGHNVVGEAPDGEVAIELYKEKRPDLIILDISMPNTDGLSTLKKIIEIDQDANIIICSALDQADKIREAIIAGAREYIIKPIYERKIIIAIHKVLSKRRADSSLRTESRG